MSFHSEELGDEYGFVDEQMMALEKGSLYALQELLDEYGCRCPDCGYNMVKIAIDCYRCTACGEKWEAR